MGRTKRLGRPPRDPQRGAPTKRERLLQRCLNAQVPAMTRQQAARRMGVHPTSLMRQLRSPRPTAITLRRLLALLVELEHPGAAELTVEDLRG